MMDENTKTSEKEEGSVTQSRLDGGPITKKKHKKRKASNGRLKKLWRRATTHTKGITSRKEWNEMLELHSQWKSCHQNNTDLAGDAMMGLLPGPTVFLSKQQSQDYTNIDNWQVTEGSDHRDIIVNFLFRKTSVEMAGGNSLQKKKKRKLEDDVEAKSILQSSMVNVPTLPSWSTMCNLGGTGGLAVIEICIEDCLPGSPCPLMPSERVKEVNVGKNTPASWTSLFCSTKDNATTSNNSKVQRGITACKVQLFQGNKHPRSLSDVLMFLPPQVEQNKHDTGEQSSDIRDSIYKLRLTPKQMVNEGYPFVEERDLESSAGSKESVQIKIGSFGLNELNDMGEDNVLDLIKTVASKVSVGEDDSQYIDEFTGCEHYVKTFSRNEDVSTRRPKVFSIDCEMVQTLAGVELARVSVIEFVGDRNDEKFTLVLDELVKPRRDVLDYLTQYSGITPKMLMNVKTRIDRIQLMLLTIIHEEDIIIGHSAENDLRSLRLVHNNIVDTSIVFRGTTGRKFSLKHLSNVLLQRQIQNGSGHCSTEDAEASLILALRRAKVGPSFRLKESARHKNILDVLRKVNGDQTIIDENTGESSFAERNERASVCIGPNQWLTSQSVGNGSQHLLSCETIMSSMAMAVPSWLASKKPSRAGILWAKLVCEGRHNDFKDELKKQDEIINSLVNDIPTDTPILVIFQRNYTKASALTNQRKAATNPKATCDWTSYQEEEWKQYMSSCRNCEAFWIGSLCHQAKR